MLNVSVPNGKFEAMSFKALYNEELQETYPINLALSVCKEVRESVKLRKLIHVLLLTLVIKHKTIKPHLVNTKYN